MWNNSSMMNIDDGFFDYILYFRQIVWGYIGMILSVSGIVGNIITIIVLLSPTTRTISTNLYLTALSCSNILYLLIFIPFISLRYILYYRSFVTKEHSVALTYLLRLLPILTPMYHTILLSIIYLTIAVSLDRLILIKFSLKSKQIFSPRTVVLSILTIYIFSIAYCIPFWFEQRYDPETEECTLTDIGKRIHQYIRVYLYIPIFCLIPFITLTYINITIIQSLIAKKRRKKSLGVKRMKKNSADFHITLMLVIIIIVSVLCYIPLTALHAWYSYDPRGSYQNLLFHVFYMLGEFMLVLNVSTNFLLHCFFGEKFRQILIEYISHIMTNQNQQVNVQTRLFQLSLIRRSEERRRTTLARNSTASMYEFKKSNEFNDSLKQYELSPLETKSEQVTIIDENLDLHPCANGR